MPVNFMTTLKAFIDNKIVIMKNNLSPQQIAQFRQDGFLVIEDFLSADELQQWRSALDEALAKRKSNKLPDRAAVYGKGDDADKEYIGMERDFKSFMHAAEEASISRLYGGIHYRLSLDKGLETGIKVGHHVLTVAN